MNDSLWRAFLNSCLSTKTPYFFGDLAQKLTRAESLALTESIACEIDKKLSNNSEHKVVAIHLPRDVRFLSAMFAVWKRGDAFVPLNRKWPKLHLKKILELAAPDIVVTDDATFDAHPNYVVLPKVETLLQATRPTKQQEILWSGKRESAEVAYIIFTSGSTGEQKGVQISHHAYQAYCLWAARNWDSSNDYRSLVITAELTFDITLGDIAFALAHDTEIHVSPDPGNLYAHAKLIMARNVDVFYSVPSTISRLFPLAETRSDFQLSGLKLVKAGGDVFSPDLIDLVGRVAPDAEFHNVYGPTEFTINCVSTRVDNCHDKISDVGLVPIGRPFDHLSYKLLNEEILENGSSQGELVIGGVQAMIGYKSDPEKTRDAFVDYDSRSYYRTGDLVLRDQDGYLFVLGRIDSLVKVRGYRLNPTSIDNALLDYDGVREAKTVFVEDVSGDGRLFSFVVLRKGVEEEFLVEHCRDLLPSYSIPERIEIVTSLPIGSSGKYDSKKLLEMAKSGLL